jgi:hypothetical protein
MMLVSVAPKSHTAKLGPTPWFYRSVISFDPNKPSDYTETAFQKDRGAFSSMLSVDDKKWKENKENQIMQLFITTSVRMNQIKKMKGTFVYGLYFSLAIPLIGLLLKFVQILYIP